jgi:sterol desaturase/sphingolipid hydroxylase (fatty acid hydroxylase superfamily)
VESVVKFLFLDFFHYLSHRLHHAIPLLWRLHRLHHSDRNVNALTTVLHHPLEIATGFIGLIVAAVTFDVPVIVLTVYSVVFGLHSAFTHLNLVLPPPLDRWLKWVVVTPNFHRVHHALDMRDSNSNFGLIFVFWDYLFRTVAQQSRSQMEFGISRDQTPQQDSIGAYLANPLR